MAARTDRRADRWLGFFVLGLRRLGFKHRYFLWIQLGFLLVFLLLVIYWLFQNRVHWAALNHPLSTLTGFLAAAL